MEPPLPRDTAPPTCVDPVRELASGVDALYMSGRGSVSAALLSDLESAKLHSQEADDPVAVDLGGVRALVGPSSLGRYAFRLETPHGLVGVMRGESKLPPLRIQPWAEHLHAVGAVASVSWFEQLVGGFTRDLRLSAARLDVFSDWQGFELGAEDRARFVGRATKLATHEQSGDLTGFEFGRRKTKTISARIYDKGLDVQRKGNLWWRDIWGDAYDPARQVLRVEFEFGRLGLKQYGVDSAKDALAAAPSLYRTASTEWLSLRRPTADATRSRWPVDQAWLAVQQARFAERSVGLDRVREGHIDGSLRALMPAMTGYFASFCALVGAEDLEHGLTRLPRSFYDYELVSHVPFGDRVKRKRQKYRLP